MLKCIEEFNIEIGKAICFKEFNFFSKKYIGEIILLNKENGYITIKTLKNKFKTVHLSRIYIFWCDNYKNKVV